MSPSDASSATGPSEVPAETTWGRAPGQPCWVDLAVPDVPRAARFYASTLGWILAGEDDARTALVDGRRVAGLAPVRRAFATDEVRRDPSGRPSWTVWFTTADVGEASRRVEALGGALVRAPARLPRGAGTALARDPSGAAFGLWQPDPDPGFGAAHRPGAYDWCDLFTPDGRAAQRFYAELFGADVRPLGTDGNAAVAGRTDAFLIVHEEPVAAVFERNEPAHWLVFFEVDDADAAAAACERGGGRVAEPPSDTPYGRLALLVDPFGAPFGINRVRERA